MPIADDAPQSPATMPDIHGASDRAASQASPLSETQRAKALAVCAALADGLSLRQACRADGAPKISTFLLWVSKDAALAEHYARARDVLLEHWAEEVREISDDDSEDWYSREDGRAPNPVRVQRDRLRVDSRKWFLSKLAPKKYGDRVEVAGDATAPLTVVVRRMVDGPDASAPGVIDATPERETR